MMAARRTLKTSHEQRDREGGARRRRSRRRKGKKAATDPYAFEMENDPLPPGAGQLTDEDLKPKLPYWVDIG